MGGFSVDSVCWLLKVGLRDYFSDGVDTPELVLLGRKNVLFSVTILVVGFCSRWSLCSLAYLAYLASLDYLCYRCYLAYLDYLSPLNIDSSFSP